MNDTDRHQSEMVVRALDFNKTRPAAFPAETLGGELFAALDAAVKELAAHAAKQASGQSAAQAGTTSRAAARAALREDLEAIRRTARAIALEDPDFLNKFRLPRGKINDQQLLATARAFAADAAPAKNEFVRHEMPADFLDDLNADIADFETAIAAQNQSQAAHVAATAAIDATLERAVNIVRRLDAIVRNKFRNDPQTLAGWLSATHVERTRRRQPQSPPPAPPK
jgi:hypothetical protein